MITGMRILFMSCLITIRVFNSDINHIVLFVLCSVCTNIFN